LQRPVTFEIGDYRLDPSIPELRRGREVVALGLPTLLVLAHLVRARDRTVSGAELLAGARVERAHPDRGGP
jgi:DNA-binding winged helix-turn-helix (wHTH) protein